MMAIGAMNDLNNTNSMLSQSMTRLSTGLKINSAADDPSGYIIAQQMTAQIGGMNQAISNSQQAINYVKTAGGALSQVETLLDSARTLAVGAANSATLSTAEVQADQLQLQSIVSSITQIAQQTTYGTKHLLDGSSGIQSSITDGPDISALSIGGQFGGATLSQSGTITLNSLTAALQATDTLQSFASTSSLVTNTGSFTINGTTFTASSTTTAGDLINDINAASTQTGVTASYESGAIQLTSNAYGSDAQINLVDADGVIRSGGAGTDTKTGSDATATLAIGGVTANFTGGQNGADGLTLTDANGNSFSLTVPGNTTVTTPESIGQLIIGSAQFQIGADYGQTSSLSIQNFAASNLGQGVVSGSNLSNLDITTQQGANQALQVIDQAISQVATAQGQLGNFQTNTLQTNVNTLTTAQQNLTSSLSTIQDTNVAQEMTNFTQLQILEQSGMAILSQANQLPQQILSLIKQQ